MLEMKTRSIFRASIGKRGSRLREEYPVPKSSMLSRTPSDFSSDKTERARSASPIAIVSMISRLIVLGSTPVCRSISPISFANSAWANCLGVMFMLMVRGGSQSNCDCQNRSCWQASSNSALLIGRMSPVSSATGMNSTGETIPSGCSQRLKTDDWATAPLNETERREVWEICEDRYQTRSTILTSQLPVSRWHEQIGDPTIADGILDRLVHNAHRIEMRGESMRKKRNPPPEEDNQ